MIYSETDYRRIIKDRVEACKSNGLNFQRLAEKTSIPKSYVSKVMNGTADFNRDQLFKVAQVLQLGDEELEYLELLLEFERCQLKARREWLAARIKSVRVRKLEAKEHLKSRVIDADDVAMAEYYFEPTNHVVHLALSIPRFQRDPAALANALGFSLERVERAITTLTRLGLAKRKPDGSLCVGTFDTHLPRNSAVFNTWRDQVRLLSLHRQRQIDSASTYNFSVVFTATEQVRLAIQARFLQFLGSIKPEVDEATSEECYQINFDLFRWS